MSYDWERGVVEGSMMGGETPELVVLGTDDHLPLHCLCS